MSKEHKVLISNRKILELEGVTEVINFAETEINLESNLGNLMIKGENLHVKHLDLDSKHMIVEGYIIELCYDQESKTENFLKRLFK